MHLHRWISTIENGLEVMLYRGEWKTLSDFAKFRAEKRKRIWQIDLNQLETPEYNFALQFTGHIEIPRKGDYTFYTKSNDVHHPLNEFEIGLVDLADLKSMALWRAYENLDFLFVHSVCRDCLS